MINVLIDIAQGKFNLFVNKNVHDRCLTRALCAKNIRNINFKQNY